MTALTFGWASAADVSMETIRACAYGLARTAPKSMPGQLHVVEEVAPAAEEPGVLLAEHAPEPDRVAGRRHWGLVGTVMTASFPVWLGGPADGLDDVVVARAAAQLAADRLADLVLAGVGVAVEQRSGRSSSSPGCRTRTAARGTP